MAGTETIINYHHIGGRSTVVGWNRFRATGTASLFFRVALNITAVAEAEVELRRNFDGAPRTAVAETKLRYYVRARNNSTFYTVSEMIISL
jgi:hypothetical protein